MKIDIVIPTYKPDEKFMGLLQMLVTQSVEVNKIIVMNTEEKYMDAMFFGRDYEEVAQYVEIHHISQWEFDHGMTRNDGAAYSNADIVVFMTQDAVPKNQYLLENLIKPFEDPTVAVSYARQLPAEGSTLAEYFSRSFNYPTTSEVKTAEDIERLGIKTFFCSNVCAAYPKALFDELGGFIKGTIFNEDMIFAAGAIAKGKKVVYTAEAEVIHSHSYTNQQQFRRNFDLAVSQADHPEVFDGISSESEGKKYVLAAFKFFRKKKKGYLIIPFVITCVWKYFGFRLGKNYRNLSHRRILRYTMNPKYFKKKWSDRMKGLVC